MKNKDKIIILKAKIIKLKDKLKAARLELADRDNEKSFERTNLFTYFTPEIIDEIKQRVEKKIEAELRCNPIESNKHPNDGGIMLFNGQPIEQIEYNKEIAEMESKPLKEGFIKSNIKELDNNFLMADPPPPPKSIESTKELFEGKGYVYYLDNEVKRYAMGLELLNERRVWSNSIDEAKKYSSLEEFKNEYELCQLDVKFEPIESMQGFKKVVEQTENKGIQFEPITSPITPPTKENIDYDMGG